MMNEKSQEAMVRLVDAFVDVLDAEYEESARLEESITKCAVLLALSGPMFRSVMQGVHAYAHDEMTKEQLLDTFSKALIMMAEIDTEVSSFVADQGGEDHFPPKRRVH